MVINTPDNGCIIVGSRAVLNRRSDIYVLKIDAEGNLLWEIDFGSEEYDYPQDIVRCSDGNFLLAHRNKNEISLTKINMDGAVLWSKSVTPIQAGFKVNLVALQDATYRLFYRDELSNNNFRFFALHIDAAGNALNKDTLLVSDWPDDFVEVHLTSENDFLAIGMKGHNFFVSKSHNFIKINQAGETVWDTVLAVPHDSYYFKTLKLSENNEGHFLIPYAIDNSDYYSFQDSLFLINMSPDGNILWRRFISDGYRWSHGCRIDRSADGHFLISHGQHEDQEYVIKINEEGELLDTYEYETYGKSRHLFASAPAAADNGLFLCGHAINLNTTDILLIKAMGQRSVVEANLVQQFNEVLVFPNPVTENTFQLFLDNFFIGELKIKILDVKGQPVYFETTQKTFPIFEKDVNIENLPAGIYFVQFEYGDENLIRKLVKL